MSQNINIERNIVFGQTDKEYLTADVYRPSEGGDLPAVILIHGGAFQSGSKEMYSEWGSLLAKSGIVAITINYRLTTPTYSTWPGILNDVGAAVNWLISKSNEWNVEPQRIGLIGDSAGAHLAAQYALTNAANASFKIRTVIGVYGIYDLEEECNSLCINKDKIEKLIGATFDEEPETYRKASPINRIDDAISNPIFDTSFFIIWADADKVALPSHSENFVAKLEAVGIETKKLIIPNKGHFWFNVLPGLEGGSLQDYPNTEVVPKVLEHLNEKLLNSTVGNFSMTRIKELKELM